MSESSPPSVERVIARVIAVRGAQGGAAAVAALLALRTTLPPHRFRRVLLAGGALTTAGLSAFFTATFVAAIPLGAPVQTRLPSGKSDVVALTFDDGPDAETTPRFLDILAGGDARATFFLLGDAASRRPDLVRRIAEAGHAIGIHGLRHEPLVLQTARELEADLREAICRIEDAAGAPIAPLLRPPYGFKSVTLSRVARKLGLRLVAWSVNPRDYRLTAPGTLVRRTLPQLRPGAIVLLHEGPHARATGDALPEILAFCARRGWRCVSLEGI